MTEPRREPFPDETMIDPDSPNRLDRRGKPEPVPLSELHRDDQRGDNSSAPGKRNVPDEDATDVDR